MPLLDVLFGRPLATYEEKAERIGPATGIAVFGLDALGSAAYGPEAGLTVLIPLGAAGAAYIVPLSVSIIVLLAIVYFSYRQTIAEYPGGGGSYTVARANLGPRAGLLAASALMIDYILVVAVGIAAGVGAVVSAAPGLQPHMLGLCLAILLVITIVNLRGTREAGVVFMIPAYVFVGCLLVAIGLGLAKTLAGGGNPLPVIAPPAPPPAREAVSAWLLLRAFANGCTAMTGVEAVSNGVTAFRDPGVKNARRTLTVIIALLMILLAGIAWLVRVYDIGATEPGRPGYQSVLSMLIAAVAGKGAFYYVSIASILIVLAFQANTAFADFPRLCSAIARDGYLPRSFATRGRRLVYSQGINVLALLSALLIVMFGGVTDRLIPLFAVGAFLAFTLSQAGMVVHWKRTGGPRAAHSMIVNGVGAIATAITVAVVLIAKFAEGAWLTVAVIPAFLLLMTAVRRHYRRVEREIESTEPLDLTELRPPLVVIAIERWSRAAQKALRVALAMSDDIRALHIDCGEDTQDLRKAWRVHVQDPAQAAGLRPPELVVLPSPYRHVITPIVEYILELEQKNQGRQVAVIIPELVERRWYHYFLHNQRAEVLKALLLVKGDQRIFLVNVPWYLKA